MTKIEIARKALDQIGDVRFGVSASAYEGGACGDGWSDVVDYFLGRNEILSVIHDRFCLDGIIEKSNYKYVDVDYESDTENIAYDGCWPDGAPGPHVQDAIPEELQEIAEDLESLDEEDEEELDEMRERLSEVEDGEYTFTFYIGNYDYDVCDDSTETLELTAKEALGLLYDAFPEVSLFEEFDVEKLNEDFVNQKAEEAGIGGDDSYTYSVSVECIDNYFDSWGFLLELIKSGEITESNLDDMMKFFNDECYNEQTMDRWYHSA